MNVVRFAEEVKIRLSLTYIVASLLLGVVVDSVKNTGRRNVTKLTL
jgi:hypothetical protein